MTESFDVTPKTTEHNLIVRTQRTGKSEAEVTNNKVMHRIPATPPTQTYRRRADRRRYQL